MKLSIIVPTYNRYNEMAVFMNKLVQSLVNIDKELIELVVVDDGSSDKTKELLSEFERDVNINYIFQKNLGRGQALKNGISNARGEYTVLLDSDDYFLENGVKDILSGISDLELDSTPKNVNALLFGLHLIKEDKKMINMPPNLITNFIEIRADFGIKEDLKQVVRTDVLKANVYDFPSDIRRVPTSLLWAKVSDVSKCISYSKAIAVKEYLPGGMTDKILLLKTKYSLPMVELYHLLSESKSYKSKLYRWRCRLLWARHSFHLGKYEAVLFWQFLLMPVGFFLYQYDLFKLKNNKRH